MTEAPVGTQTWVGQSLPRFEDQALLRGRGRFLDDLDPVPGAHHAPVLRSPHAHARIRRLDVSHAESMDGVTGALTGADDRAGPRKNLIMRGKRLNAAEALDVDVLTEVHAAAHLDAAVDSLIDELTALSPLALSIAKRVLDHAYEGPLGLGLELEGLAYGLLRSSHDFEEGVTAFVDKRTPQFEGR
jgi:enoyl-CoA hydratase/carnithine racemase